MMICYGVGWVDTLQKFSLLSPASLSIQGDTGDDFPPPSPPPPVSTLGRRRQLAVTAASYGTQNDHPIAPSPFSLPFFSPPLPPTSGLELGWLVVCSGFISGTPWAGSDASHHGSRGRSTSVAGVRAGAAVVTGGQIQAVSPYTWPVRCCRHVSEVGFAGPVHPAGVTCSALDACSSPWGTGWGLWSHAPCPGAHGSVVRLAGTPRRGRGTSRLGTGLWPSRGSACQRTCIASQSRAAVLAVWRLLRLAGRALWLLAMAEPPSPGAATWEGHHHLVASDSVGRWQGPRDPPTTVVKQAPG